MMKKQTTEFIRGYLYAEASRKLLKRKEKYPDENYIRVEIQVPKLFFVGPLGPNKTRSAHIDDSELRCLSEELTETLSDCFVHWKLHTHAVCERSSYYVEFVVQCYREQPKELTVTEIEKLLGYKIKIISEIKKHESIN